MSGTKRTPINRQHPTGLISPQILSLYRHTLVLQKRAHLSQADLEAFSRAESDLNRALGLKMWDVGIFEDFMFVDRNGKPLGPPDRNADGWHRTRELRRQLAEADHELRRQEHEARRQEREERRAKAAPSPSPEQPEPPTSP